MLLLSPFGEVRALLNNLLPSEPTPRSTAALVEHRRELTRARNVDNAHPATASLSFREAALAYGCPTDTAAQVLRVFHTHPHLVRARLQFDTMINDTGNTQLHVVMGTPYFSPLPLFPQPFLVGMSRQKHCLFVVADWMHANAQIGSPWQAVAQKALHLRTVLSRRSLLGLLPAPPHQLGHPGALTSGTPFARIATWLRPIEEVEALEGKFLHPIEIANALGYPPSGPFLAPLWRLPPGSILVVASHTSYPVHRDLARSTFGACEPLGCLAWHAPRSAPSPWPMSTPRHGCSSPLPHHY